MNAYKLLRSYIKNNKNLIFKTTNVKNIHDYKILTVLDYSFNHMKININVCPNCESNNIIYDDQKTCIDCGSVFGKVYVTSYNQKDNYTRCVNNMYKRKTHVERIINQKLNDLSGNMKERIINETNNFNLIKLI